MTDGFTPFENGFRFMLSIYQRLFFLMSVNEQQVDYSSAKFITS